MAASTAPRVSSPLDNILSKAKDYGLAVDKSESNVEETRSELYEKLSLLIQLKSQLSANHQLLEAAQHLLPVSISNDQHKMLKSNVLQSLEQMSTDLESFLLHMDRMISKKDHITQYLQTPFSSEYLVVEAEHQAKFLELYRGVSSFLLHLPSTLVVMEWASKFSLSESQLERKLWSLSTFLAKCQRYGDALNHISSLTKELM